MSLSPQRDFRAITGHIASQLLQSDLSASMLPGTGLPRDVATLNNAQLPGGPVLVEVVAALRSRGYFPDPRFEIYVDGGVRRATDVLKAIALGATAGACSRVPPP